MIIKTNQNFIMHLVSASLRMVVVFICIICICKNTSAQTNVFRTTKGQISFVSKAPLETITATSYEMKGIIDPVAGTFAFVVPIQTFKGFNNGLQQQHFYENYLESSRYPDATFTGKFIEETDLSKPGTYVVRAKGQLTIHGRKQERILKTEIISNGTEIVAKSQFMVPLSDHHIEVPRIVNQKIAHEIEVQVRTTLILAGKS